MKLLPVRRRALLVGAANLAAPVLAQSSRESAGIAVAQIFDGSAGEQDVTKDFLVGSRAAWQDINARAGLRGRPVQHLELQCEVSSSGLQQAWRAAREHPQCVALAGTAASGLAARLAELLREERADIAQAAPWLQDSAGELDERTFPIFSGRQEQITHALRSLSISGMQEVGAVYASAAAATRHRDDVARAAELLRLRLATWTGNGNLAQLGQRLGPGTPAVLLFVGGTPELVEFTQGLERQARQRYVVALADVNLQTVQQMGGGRTTPVIATQAVPLVTAPLPIVRRYRAVLARLFDEPPTALSLAGFISAHYTFQVLAGMDSAVTRAGALAAFRRQQEMDVGGYRVHFRAGRSAAFVTQSMLTPDGRVVG